MGWGTEPDDTNPEIEDLPSAREETAEEKATKERKETQARARFAHAQAQADAAEAERRAEAEMKAAWAWAKSAEGALVSQLHSEQAVCIQRLWAKC